MTSVLRPRRLPYLLVGLLLVLGCTAGGVVVATKVGHQEPVLVLARAVTVGQTQAEAEGQPVAYSLPAGTPLTEDLLGQAHVPPVGLAVAAVALKAGQFPPGVQPGNHVIVVMAPTNANETSTPSSAWGASVTDVRNNSTDQLTVISLQMVQEDARRLAAAPTGQISVVMVHGGRK